MVYDGSLEHIKESKEKLNTDKGRRNHSMKELSS